MNLFQLLLPVLLSLNKAHDKKIQVWDSVLSSEVKLNAHQFASKAGLSHRIFHRSGCDDVEYKNKLSYLEQVL